MKKYIVTLTDEERTNLNDLARTGTAAAYKITHARVLLKADAAPGGPAWTDQDIADALDVSRATVERLRERFVEEGLDAVLARKQGRASRARTFDGAAEARLIALACAPPPEGRASWTLRLLAEKLVELEVVEAVSHETVRQALKKNELKPHLKEQWCIPPGQDAEFVAAMEDVLEVYHRPHDPDRPVVCVDEATKQLIGETRQPIGPVPGQLERFDFEYVRNGTANLFLVSNPLEGSRYVEVTQRRTAVDFARLLKVISDELYAEAGKIVLVMDNLNTHKLSSLYQAFAPEEARRLWERFEVHHTPKHGSWLNMAEIELSVLARQCLGQRFGDRESLEAAVLAWQIDRNERDIGIDWQFTTQDARIHLKHLYPSTPS